MSAAREITYLASDILLVLASDSTEKPDLIARLIDQSERSSYVTGVESLRVCGEVFHRLGANFQDFLSDALPMFDEVWAIDIEDLRRAIQIQTVSGIAPSESLEAAICIRRGAVLMSRMDSFDSVAGMARIAP